MLHGGKKCKYYSWFMCELLLRIYYKSLVRYYLEYCLYVWSFVSSHKDHSWSCNVMFPFSLSLSISVFLWIPTWSKHAESILAIVCLIVIIEISMTISISRLGIAYRYNCCFIFKGNLINFSNLYIILYWLFEYR